LFQNSQIFKAQSFLATRLSQRRTSAGDGVPDRNVISAKHTTSLSLFQPTLALAPARAAPRKFVAPFARPACLCLTQRRRDDSVGVRELRQGDFRIADVLFDGTMRRGRSDSRLRHRPVGSATEYDGLEDSPYARTVGNASRLAPELRGIAGDKLPDQASTVASLCGSLSKRDLYFFKELLPLRLRKTNDQPNEARQ